MSPYTLVKYLHSGLRFVVLILILVAIVQAFSGRLGKKSFTEGNRKINLFTLISAHLQLIIGLYLYYLSPFVQFSHEAMKVKDTRYWTSEHITMMILAIILITIGYSKSKRAIMPEVKHRNVAIYYSLAVLIIIVAIALSGRSFVGISA